MAIGFPPKFVLDTPLDGLSKHQYLALAWYTFRSLRWELSAISDTGISAYTKGKDAIDSQFVMIELADYSALITSKTLGFGFSDMGANQENIDQFLHRYREVLGTTTPEILDQFFASTIAPLINQENATEKFEKGVKANKLSAFMQIVQPRPGYTATPLIAGLILALWLIQIFSGTPFLSPNADDLNAWGALNRADFIMGDGWRLLSSIFLTKGVLYIIFSLYAVIHAGLCVEPIIGRNRMLFAFIFCGVTGNLAAVSINDSLITMGPLPAVFGIYGMAMVLMADGRFTHESRPLTLAGLCVLIISAIYALLIKRIPIDFAGYLGGFVAGAVLGVIQLSKYISSRASTSAAIYAVLSVLLVGGAWQSTLIRRNIDEYAQRIQEFDRCEELAGSMYGLKTETYDKAFIHKTLNDQGINSWDRCKRSLQKIDLEDLPTTTKEEVEKSIEYCDLRMKCYRLQMYSLDDDSENLNDQINMLENQFQERHYELMQLRKAGKKF